MKRTLTPLTVAMLTALTSFSSVAFAQTSKTPLYPRRQLFQRRHSDDPVAHRLDRLRRHDLHPGG